MKRLKKKRKVKMKSYRNQNNIKCCANCKYSFMRIGTTLHCNNKNEWLKESAVQHIGICNSFEFAISLGTMDLNIIKDSWSKINIDKTE